jgi:hypothetical protein
MKIKLPGVLKRLKPLHWAIIGGVVLAVLYLMTHKGTGASASAGTTTSSGGGGTSDTSTAVTGQPSVDWMALLTQQQEANTASNAAWQTQLLAMLQGTPQNNPPVVASPAETPTTNGGLLAPFSPTPAAPAGLIQIASPPGGVFNPNVFNTIGTSASPQSLSSPSGDTVGLLNQYLYAYRNPTQLSGAWGGFTDPAQVKSQIVQLTAGILGAGSSYYGGYSLAPADVTLAQKLNAGNNFSLSPQFANALNLGLNQTAVTQPMAGVVGANGVVPSAGIPAGGTTAGSAATALARTAMTLTQYNAANRAAIISRGAGGVSTAGVNATVRSDYDKYLASLK